MEKGLASSVYFFSNVDYQLRIHKVYCSSGKYSYKIGEQSFFIEAILLSSLRFLRLFLHSLLLTTWK